MLDQTLTPFSPITVRIREACRITGIGRSKLYMLISAGEIETIKVGRMTLIPIESIDAFISSRRATQPVH